MAGDDFLSGLDGNDFLLGDDGKDILNGGAGNDTINGTPLDDFFNLSQGGNDTVTGGAGNDAFMFGAAFTAFDSVDGGPGTNDQVGLQGDYSGGLTLGASSLVNVEVLAVLPGFSYNITSIDANVATGQELSVFGGNLLAGNNFTFNGSAETNGRFRMFGGLGTDSFTGGAQEDGFYFGPGKWGAGDSVTGGGGFQDRLSAMNALGRVLVIGNASREAANLNPNSLMKNNVSVTGVWLTPLMSVPGAMQAATAFIYPLLTSGAVKPQVGQVFKLEDAGKAFELMFSRGSTGKVIIEP